MEFYDFKCQPSAAWLTVNQACNMRCKWCYGESQHFDPNKFMSWDLAKELVDISVDAGVSHFNIIGGEPTLWAPLFSLLKHIREKGATGGLITNATRFGDDVFWKNYQNCPADRISISVKSADRDQFFGVTGSSQFDMTMLGIKRAVKLHKTGVTTVHNSLVGLEGLRHIAVVCRDLGANSIIVNMCSPTITDNGDASTGYSIAIERLADETIEMVEFLDDLYDGEAEVDIQMPLCLFPASFVEENLAKKKIMTLCQIFSRSGINFDYSGNVTVCNEFAVEPIARKNIDFVDGTSLMKYLNSDEVCLFYEQILRYPSNECKKCRWQRDCRGGCLMNWLVFEPSICHAA